jgi:DNA-binding NarL/FixJ family response regulator
MTRATLTIDIPLSELQDMVERLAAGERVELGVTLLLQSAPPSNELSALGRLLAERGLSPRQIEIIELDRTGLFRQKIAQQLAISERTVDWHWEAVKRKLKLRSVSEVRNLIDILYADL